MKPTIKLYLKIFIISVVLHGLISVIFDFSYGDETSLDSILISSAPFGLILTSILVPIHIWVVKKNGIKKITSDTLNVNQSKSIKTELNKSELMEKFKKDPIIGKMQMTDFQNGILIKSGISWKSWGEEIKIVLKSEENSEFEYQISSSPSLKTTLIDYGKNLENVNRVERVISNIA